MRGGPAIVLLFAVGCRSAEQVPQLVEAHVAAIAPAKAELNLVPEDQTPPIVDGPVDLAALWQLALAHNPSLREAAAAVEAARGQRWQSEAYPNPRVGYHVEELGSHLAPPGNMSVEVNQEIVTGGKRRLDIAVAERHLGVATLELLGRKFEVLTRIRRAYYEYLGLADTLQVNTEVVAALEEGVENTRKLVEVVKTRPRTDLLRLQALLDQANINLARTRTSLQASWKQLTAEVGVLHLPMPAHAESLPQVVPHWQADAVTERVLAANTDLAQAATESERARLEYERARAEAIPNVTVGAGYIRGFVEETAGAVLNVETTIPAWDCKKGLIHEMRAKWAQAQAAERTTANRLSRDAAEAFARYEGARVQAEKLATTVLPRLEESLKLVREGYQAGAKDLSFADVELAVEALNESRLKLAETQREMWRAVADLQGLMQLDLHE
jgi:cobalt-zinc-cadmium efflux system outer membrane protein